MLQPKYILCLLICWTAFISNAGKRDSLKAITSSGSIYSKLEAANDLAAIYETYKPDSCLHFAELALDFADEANSDSGRMEAHYNFGLAHYQFQEYDACVSHCSMALELSNSLNDTIFKGLILYKLSRAHSKMARYDLTIQSQLDAIRFYEAQKFHLGVAVMYNNMSIAYKYLGDSREAIGVLQLALKNYRQANHTIAYFTPLLNIGDNYFRLGLHDSALIYLDSSIYMAKIYNVDEPYLESYVNYWKGEVAFENRDYKTALEYFEDSHNARLNHYMLGDQVYTLLGQGRALHKLGEATKALPFLIDALAAAQEVNATKRIMMSHKALGAVYFDLGDFRNSAIHMKHQLSLRDSIFNQEKAMAIMNSRTKFQVEAKDREIEMLGMEADMANKERELATKNERLKDAELKQSQSEQLVLYLGLGFAALSILALFFVVRRRNQINKVLSNQKDEISFQNEILEIKNKEITDSITYAKRIQNAILPSKKIVQSYLSDSFIVYRPKDIVAGDFYWMEVLHGSPPLEEFIDDPEPRAKDIEEVGNTILFAVADCTGHGVPGAMVSVVCNNGLNRAVREYGLTDPGQILDKTREIVISEFEKSEESSSDKSPEDEIKDGMDIALCSLTFANVRNEKQLENGSVTSTESESQDRSASAEATGDTQTVSDYPALLRYAGAHNPLWIIRRTETGEGFVLEEVIADKQPIGKYDDPKPYTTHSIELNPGDSFYIFSDGYADQFGGEKGKKLKAKNFKNLLLSMQNEPMERQRALIDEAFQNWKGDFEQLDDVCVIGVRI